MLFPRDLIQGKDLSLFLQTCLSKFGQSLRASTAVSYGTAPTWLCLQVLWRLLPVLLEVFPVHSRIWVSDCGLITHEDWVATGQGEFLVRSQSGQT